jgi:hypothetical protein
MSSIASTACILWPHLSSIELQRRPTWFLRSKLALFYYRAGVNPAWVLEVFLASLTLASLGLVFRTGSGRRRPNLPWRTALQKLSNNSLTCQVSDGSHQTTVIQIQPRPGWRCLRWEVSLTAMVSRHQPSLESCSLFKSSRSRHRFDTNDTAAKDSPL